MKQKLSSLLGRFPPLYRVCHKVYGLLLFLIRFPSLLRVYGMFGGGSYLRSIGWMESLKRGYPCREDGSEMPWMNYPLIAFLEKRLKKDMNLFEYGSGYSTVFFSKLVARVTSVEYERTWYDIVAKKVGDNVDLVFCEEDYDGEYCRCIGRTKYQYDMVVVDGIDRVSCIRQSIASLSGGGVVLLDDSHREEEYAEGISLLKAQGFSTLDFEGLKPTRFGLWRATLFYRRNNCLGI